jgi:hypothetical protein
MKKRKRKKVSLDNYFLLHNVLSKWMSCSPRLAISNSTNTNSKSVRNSICKTQLTYILTHTHLKCFIWGMIMRSKGFFRRSKERSWDRKSFFSWDRNFFLEIATLKSIIFDFRSPGRFVSCRSDHEIESLKNIISDSLEKGIWLSCDQIWSGSGSKWP